MKDIPEDKLIKYIRSGSSFICDPPVTDTDIDYVLFVTNKLEICKHLIVNGWVFCGNEAYNNPDNDFLATRNENINYILVDDEPTFDQWEAATLLAKQRNLLKKEERVALFRNIFKGQGKKPCKLTLEMV